MATNPFTAKSYVDKAKEDLKKDSQQQSRADVPKPSTPSTSTTKENVFTEKAKGYSKGRSSKEDYVPTNQVKEGLYAELNTEGSGSGKLMINRADESTRFTGNTYSGRSGKNPDFSGETIIASSEVRDSRGNLIYSARTYDNDRQPNVIEGSFGSGVVRSVERGEPNAVYTSQTGRSTRERSPSEKQVEFTQQIKEAERQKVIARAVFEERRRRQIQEAKDYEKRTGVSMQYKISRLESASIVEFADTNALFKAGVSRKVAEDNPQYLLFAERDNYERDVSSKATALKLKDIQAETGGGKVTEWIYGGVAPVRLVGDVGFGVSGRKTRLKYAEELYYEDLINQGVSPSDARRTAKRLSITSAVGGDVVESSALIVGPELISERVAGASLSKGLANLGKIEVESSFKPILQKTVIPSAKLGAREGAESVALQNIASGSDIQPLEVGLGAGFGAGSAPLFLALPLAFQPKRPGVAKVLRGTGEALEFGQETGGDLLAKTRLFSNLEDVRLVQRVEDIDGKKFVSFSGRKTRVKSPVLSFSPVDSVLNTKASVSSVGVNTRVSQPLFSLNTINVADVPSNVPSYTFTPVSQPLRDSVPSEVEVPVTSSVPVISESVVPNVVSTSGLPLIPPIFDFGGSSKGRSVRQGKKYYNELALGLSLLGSTSKKKSKSMKKDRGNKRKSVNLGFGGLGMINLGRV